MTNYRDVLTQALEALVLNCGGNTEGKAVAAIAALRAALADHYCDTHCTWLDHAPGCDRAEQQEPVAKTGKAYVDSLIDTLLLPLPAMTASDLEALHRRCAEMLLMYAATAPQPAKRVPLTDEEIDRVLGTPIPGGSNARDWFLPHETPRGLANVRGVVRLMIEAAHGITGEQASLLHTSHSQ